MVRVLPIVIGTLLLLPIVTPAKATWRNAGGFEPDSAYDDVTLMYTDPPGREVGRIYFNAVPQLAGTGINPNNGLAASQLHPGGVHDWRVYLGTWTDCNGDGYIGQAETLALEYPGEALLDTSVCPRGNTHWIGGWIHEFLWIGPTDSIGDQNLNGAVDDDIAIYAPGALHDADARVWGDNGLPWSGDETCPVRPARGTTASTGGILGHADCHANRRVAYYTTFIADETGADGSGQPIRFEDTSRPQTSRSMLNQDLPANLWGNPHEGAGAGHYRGGLLEDGRASGGATYDPTFTTWDCAQAGDIPDPLNVNLPRDPTNGALSGPVGGIRDAPIIWQADGSPAADPTPGGNILRIPGIDPRVDIDRLLTRPTDSGSLYDAANHTIDGCRHRDGGGDPLYPAVESGASAGQGRRTSDLVFRFEGYPSGSPTTAGAPPDGGATPSRGGQGIGWLSQTQTLTESHLIRGDGRPSGATYFSFYAYVGSETTSRGLRAPGGSGIYGSAACGPYTSGVHDGWNCGREAWYRDDAGGDIMPQQAYGPQNVGWGQARTSPWGQSRGIGVPVSHPYQLRDIDCFDGSASQGSPAYLSTQYLTDDDACADSVGAGVLHPAWAAVPELDEDFNGIGDVFQSKYKLTKEQIEDALADGGDLEPDRAGLVLEFRWATHPLYVPGVVASPGHASDYDQDNWEDGDEIAYWNVNPDGVAAPGGLAFRDPDSFTDTDGDGQSNQHDYDSDGDDLSDGDEYWTYGTYPEARDSDCPPDDLCPHPQDTRYSPARTGWAGDGIPDGEEITYWGTVAARWPSPNARYDGDCDDDGIPNIRDRDSDNDGLTDGDERAAGTNPCDNDVGPQLAEVARADPTNEDLPFLDEVNARYLEEGRVDGTVEATEPRIDDTVTSSLDRLLAQVDRATQLGERAEPILAETRTRVVEPVEYEILNGTTEPESILALTRNVSRPLWNTTRALLGICTKDLVPTTTEDPTSLLARARMCLGQATATAREATRIDRVTGGIDLPPPARDVISVATDVDVSVELGTRPLLDPRAAILATLDEAGAAPDAQPLAAVALPNRPATLDLTPRNLADNAGAIHEILTSTIPAGVREQALATLDAPFHNILVADDQGRTWVFRDQAPGNASLIDLDGRSTGVGGHDLLVTSSIPLDKSASALLALGSKRPLPRLDVTSLSDVTRRTPLLVCAFHQLVATPYVAATCIDTRPASLTALGGDPSGGFPDTAEVRSSAYAISSDPNVTASLAVGTQGPVMPIVASTSVFEVDLRQSAKPRVTEGNLSESILHVSDATGLAGFEIERSLDPRTGSSATWAWTGQAAGNISASYRLVQPERELLASAQAGDASAGARMSLTRDAADTSTRLTVTSRTSTPTAHAALAFQDNARGREAFSLDASLLPANLAVEADDTQSMLHYAAPSPASGLRFVHVGERADCPAHVADDHIVRRAKDAEGGACVSIAQGGPLTALTVGLPSDAPRLSVSAMAESPRSLGVAMIAAPDRALAAFLASTPTTADLQATLVMPDGSTRLSWSAATPTGATRLTSQAGGTTLAIHSAAMPSGVAVAYDWRADTVTARTSRGEGEPVTFAFTNTGQAPQIEDTDLIAGVHGGTTPPTIEASGRLGGTTDVRARLAVNEQNLAISTMQSTPLAFRYARDQGPAMSFDAAALGQGDTTLASTSTAGGSHRVTYSATEPAAGLSWRIRPTDGTHIEGSVATAPRTWALTADPSRAVIDIDAAAPMSFELMRAPAHTPLATPAGDAIVHLVGGNGRDAYHVRLADAQSISLVRSPGKLTLMSAFSAAHPLTVHIGADESLARLTTTAVPPLVDLSYGRHGITYTASGALRPDVELHVREAGNTLVFRGESIPTSAQLAWTSGEQLARMDVTHDGLDPLPLLRMEATYAGVDGGRGEYVHTAIRGAPGTVNVLFDASTDQIEATASPTPAGSLTFRHASRSSSILVPTEPNHALLHRAADPTDAAFEALHVENLTRIALTLQADAARSAQLDIVASTPNAFYAEHQAADGSSLQMRVDRIPGRLALNYGIGAAQDATAGVSMTWSSGAPVAALALRAERANMALALDATTIAPDWQLTWAPAGTMDLRASETMRVDRLSYGPAGAPAATLADADGQLVIRVDPTPQLSASFPDGIKRLVSDPVGRIMQGTLGAGYERVALLHEHSGGSSRLDLTDPPASFTLWAPAANATGNVTATWSATSATGEVTWAVDARDAIWRWHATTLPPAVDISFDPVAGVLDARSSLATGATFRLDYADRPDTPFHGEGAGVVVLVRPTGTEDYPQGLTSFSLDVPRLRALRTTFAAGSGLPLSESSLALTRAANAGAVPFTQTIAVGAEALHLKALGVGSSLDAQTAGDGTTGTRARITSPQSLTDVAWSARSGEGVWALDIARVTTYADLQLATKAIDMASGTSRAALTYLNGGGAAKVDYRAELAGMATAVTLNGAPTEFRLEAPIECAQATSGRVWTLAGQPAGRVNVTLIPRDAPATPIAEAANYLIATCEDHAATLALDLPGVESVSWTTDPIMGLARVNLAAAGATAEPAHIILTANEGMLALDAQSSAIGSGFDITGESTSQRARIQWTGTSPPGDISATVVTPDAAVEAQLQDAPAAWALRLDPVDTIPVDYSASGRAGRVVADATLPNFHAHVDADDAPTRLAWRVPAGPCPAVGAPLDARVSTEGTGSVGRLTAWTLPTPSRTFLAGNTTEHAILECSGDAAATSLDATGFRAIEWTRTSGTVPVALATRIEAPPIALRGIGGFGDINALRATPAVAPATSVDTMHLKIERDATKTPASHTFLGRLDTQEGTRFDVRDEAPVDTTTATSVLGGNYGQTHVTRSTQREGALVIRRAADIPTDVRFLDAPIDAVLTLDGRGDSFQLDYSASTPAAGLRVNTPAAGPHVRLDVLDHIPTRLVGSVSGPTPGSSANAPDCSGRERPVGMSLTTLGSGDTGRLTMQFSDDGTSVPSVQAGAVLTCEAGIRALHAVADRLDEIAMEAGACTWRVAAPAHSSKMQHYRVTTSTFDATLRILMAPGTVAAFVGEADAHRIHITSKNASWLPATPPVIANLRLNLSTVAGGAEPTAVPLPCLHFGASKVEQLDATAVDIVGELTIELGRDDASRALVSLDGAQADLISLDVALRAEERETTPAADNSTHLNLAARMQINTLDVAYSIDGADRPTPMASLRAGHHAVIRSGAKADAGIIIIRGFETASLVLDSYYRAGDGGGRHHEALFAYRGSARQPFALDLSSVDTQKDTRIALGILPTVITASLSVLEQDATGWSGSVSYEADGSSSLTIQTFQGGFPNMDIDTRLPPKLTASFAFTRDTEGDTVLSLVYSAPPAGATPDSPHLTLVHREPAAAVTTLSIDRIPPALSLTATATTCGARATLINDITIPSLRFSHFPGETAATTGDGPARKTPGCPRSKADTDPGVTDTSVAIGNIPAGTLTLDAILGHKAGSAQLTSTGGPIGSIDLTSTTHGGDDPGTFTLNAKGVTLRSSNWDIDGDTRYEGSPTVVYLDGVVDSLVITSEGKQPLHLGTQGSATFQRFQFKLPQGLGDLFQAIVLPGELQYAGCLHLGQHNLDLSVPTFGRIANLYTFAKGRIWGNNC